MGIAMVELDPMESQVTPFFKYLTVEDIPASEREGKAVHKTIEVCELRFAGDRQYTPVVPADSMFRKEGTRVITYAERFAEQYRQFLSGVTQEASGTALEELTNYGITPAQLSLCRAVKVYSIEALSAMEGPQLKVLGTHANDLKDMARRFMEDRSSGSAAQRELAALKERVAAMEAQERRQEVSQAVAQMAAEELQEEAAEQSAFAHMTEEQIKAMIKERTGQAPRGNPSRETLLRMAEEIVTEGA